MPIRTVLQFVYIPRRADYESTGQIQISTEESTEESLIENETSLLVRFIDVGQGDAILATSRGHSMLIDGGGPGRSDKIYSILKAEN